MKSPELHRLLIAELGVYFREGFKRAKGTSSGWHREGLLVWFQCDKWGWDQYAGSGFFVNFQTGASAKPWTGTTRRLQEFLSADELAEARRLQNAVITRLPTPPTAYLEMMRAGFAKAGVSSDLYDAWAGQFEPVAHSYRNDQDFTLRYFDAVDVRHWCRFLLPILPRIVAQLADEATGAER